MRATHVMLSLGLLALPGLATAGQSGETGPLSSIAVGVSVKVITTSGQELKGPVRAVLANGLVLELPLASRTVSLSEIVRVEKRDSLRNGAVIGAAIGAGLMIPTVITCGEDGGAAGACIVGVMVYGVGLGALVGAGVDALIGNQVLYTASSSRTVRLAPWASPSGAGVSGVISWR